MNDPRRQLPAVDALLTEPAVSALLARHPRALVVRAVRDTIETARADGGMEPPGGWARAVGPLLDHIQRLHAALRSERYDELPSRLELLG